MRKFAREHAALCIPRQATRCTGGLALHAVPPPAPRRCWLCLPLGVTPHAARDQVAGLVAATVQARAYVVEREANQPVFDLGTAVHASHPVSQVDCEPSRWPTPM